MPTLVGVPQQQRTTGSATNTFSYTVPATGARRALVVFVGAFHNNVQTISGVTYNGVAMTKIGSTRGSINSHGIAEIYILVNPSTGANNVVITASTALDELIGAAASWEDVNQAGPTTGDNGGDNAASANPSVTFSITGSNVGVCGLEYYTGGLDPATESGTNLAESGATAVATGWSFQYSTTSPLSWTLVSSGWAAAGFVLVHDAGGGGATQPPRSMHQYRQRRY